MQLTPCYTSNMIATMTGKIEEQNIDTLVVGVNGIGYELFATTSDISGASIGDQAKFYIYEHIREQSHDLFGFTSRVDKTLFEKLLSVNGVGPKMALSVMNIGPTADVKTAIATGQVKILQSASGVGKKVAERIVVDLKDKLGLAVGDDATAFLSDRQAHGLNDEAYDALVSLGFSSNDAVNLLRGIDNNLSTEERLKVALKGGAGK